MSRKRIKGRFGFTGRGLTYKWDGVFKDQYQKGRNPDCSRHWDSTVARARKEQKELIASKTPSKAQEQNLLDEERKRCRKRVTKKSKKSDEQR